MKNKEKWFKAVSILLVLIFAFALVMTLASCEQKCIQCDGSGKCRNCNGSGVWVSPANPHLGYLTCGQCNGGGRCRTCEGTGRK